MKSIQNLWIITLTLAALFIFSLGCSNSGNPPPNGGNKEDTTAAGSTEDTMTLSSEAEMTPAESSETNVLVNEMEQSTVTKSKKSAANKPLAKVTEKVENTTSKSVPASQPSGTTVKDAKKTSTTKPAAAPTEQPKTAEPEAKPATIETPVEKPAPKAPAKPAPTKVEENPAPTPKPKPAPSPTSASDKHWPVPDKDKNKKNPIKAGKEALSLGKELYRKHCASCHGKQGLGDGSKAAQLDTPCGDLTEDSFQQQTDGALYYKIVKGRDDMPSYKKKIPYPEDIWSIVHYLRTLK
ncbi:MAG: c-type cytochrome [Saprospiraceae bacterium]